MQYKSISNCHSITIFFQALKFQLSDLKDSEKLSQLDLIHAENVKAGRDKYKTLKQIRLGNTRDRIDQFEAL